MVKAVIESRQGLLEMNVPANERLLYCGLGYGFDLAHECATGTCGTCKAILVSGEVRSLWPEAPGNRYVRAQKNEFLMCQAVAETEVHIKVRPAVRPPISLPTPARLHGVIENYRNLTPDVAVFEYRLSSPARFAAGQFVTVNVDGIPGYRAYSMTNYSADETDSLMFVVKRIPNGRFTEWLFGDDRTGCTLNCFGPVGRAVFVPETDGEFIALAGGSGIAGIMAILQHASNCGHLDRHPVWVVFGLNRPQDVFFLETLNEYAAQHTGLNIIVALVDPDKDGMLQEKYSDLDFATGFLHEVAGARLPDLSDVSVAFLAGPPVAVDACQKLLIMERKFSPRKIRYDRFG